ncbi:MAG: hypothetical protein ACRENE_25505 [Polyangiaceae bacterium]
MRTPAYLVISAVSLFLTACSAGSGEGKGALSSATDSPSKSAVPLHHRAAATSCQPTLLPAEPTSVPPAASGDAGGLQLSHECTTHADCTDAPNGRCVDIPTFNPSTASPGTYCVYEQCTQDSNCAAGSACFCSDDPTFCAGGYSPSCSLLNAEIICTCGIANQCRKGNCRVDSDCGANGYCSPGIDPCGEVTGYYCHTAADECVNDTDCAGDDAAASNPRRCMPDPNGQTHWVCSYIAGCP